MRLNVELSLLIVFGPERHIAQNIMGHIQALKLIVRPFAPIPVQVRVNDLGPLAISTMNFVQRRGRRYAQDGIEVIVRIVAKGLGHTPISVPV
jgi:hypothetical protein